ncbi:two-component system response regulator CreB [Phragmitibacter flavus]|uniref:Two-component system response regulator CreB n=1 Tax=Phragmitibacter flavus TaxID=2576071 RepID=A0A5R8KCY0_9BACT|nr:two-component system response regulator CreB [Phragmitibacter flavus]
MNVNQSPRVLIVEDEPSIADNILYSLESEGFVAKVVGTGAEALRVMVDEDFSLLILDVGLPDMSGFEVCRKLQGLSDVPVIFLTARNTEVDRVVGLEIGGDDYLCKPFSPRELTARVRAVLRRYNGNGKARVDGVELSEGALVVKPVEVDEGRCLIRYFGSALPLSAYEFRLLKTMAKHPGRVYSRSQLMECASDEPDAAMERTVDAHVKSLRAKMKAVKEGVEPIVTHRGLGYSLAEVWEG